MKEEQIKHIRGIRIKMPKTTKSLGNTIAGIFARGADIIPQGYCGIIGDYRIQQRVVNEALFYSYMSIYSNPVEANDPMR